VGRDLEAISEITELGRDGGTMTKKAIVSIDLASMVGTMKLVPSSLRLPRGDKHLLECAVSEILLETLQQAGNIRFDSLRSNPTDPPDTLLLRKSGVGYQLRYKLSLPLTS
jgi:hypothetical protein